MTLYQTVNGWQAAGYPSRPKNTGREHKPAPRKNTRGTLADTVGRLINECRSGQKRALKGDKKMEYNKKQEERLEEIYEAACDFYGVITEQQNINHTEFPDQCIKKIAESTRNICGEYGYSAFFPFIAADGNIYDKYGDEYDSIMEKVYEELEKVLHKNYGEEYHDRVLFIEVCANYDEKISEKDIKKILEADDPEIELEEMVDWCYEDYKNELMGTEKKKIFEELNKTIPKIMELDWVRDELEKVLLEEKICVCLPYGHYMNQMIDAVISIDTGDANYEFTLNGNIAFDEWNSDVEKYASILWLAKTQGYSVPKIRKEIEKGDLTGPKRFAESLRQELVNLPSHIGTLVILAKISLHDLIKINKAMKPADVDLNVKNYSPENRPDCGTLHVSKNAEIGLFDQWNGGGSCLEIELEKDFDLPIKYIHTCLPDGCWGTWSVKDVYGIPSSVWKENIVTIKEIKEG